MVVQAGMADILAMLYRLTDRRGPHANATYIYTNTAWRSKAKIDDDDQCSLIGGTL